jgi:hypothetical protein
MKKCKAELELTETASYYCDLEKGHEGPHRCITKDFYYSNRVTILWIPNEETA